MQMHYSLLNRFRGVLLGSLIGETLAHRNKHRDAVKFSSWLAIAKLAKNRLIESGNLQRNDWEQIFQHQQVWLNLKHTATSSQTAIATLPLVLFFHEHPGLLTNKLEQAAAICLHSQEALEDVLIWGRALSLALTEKLRPSQFIDQILADFDYPQTPLVEQLKEINMHLARGSGLEEVVDRLSRAFPSSKNALALAFYFFSYTPEDFSLSVSRSLCQDWQPEIVATLSGALSGAYNGFVGIPVEWRLLVQRESLGADVSEKVQHLFAIWSGVYPPSIRILPSSVAVTSSKVMQKRSSLNIISQTDS